MSTVRRFQNLVAAEVTRLTLNPEVRQGCSQGNERQRNKFSLQPSAFSLSPIPLPNIPLTIGFSIRWSSSFNCNYSVGFQRRTALQFSLRLGILALKSSSSKAVLKPRALQTLRDCQTIRNLAKRLECGRVHRRSHPARHGYAKLTQRNPNGGGPAACAHQPVTPKTASQGFQNLCAFASLR